MRRNPDDPFDDIFRQIERMMEGMMGIEPGDAMTTDSVTDTYVDIRETDDTIIVMADLPGVAKSDINLKCDGRILSITAENDARRYAERVQLPATVVEDTATARHNNGVLEVTLERAEDSANINVE